MQFHLTENERQILVSELFETVINFDVQSVMKHLLHHAELQGKFPGGSLPTQMYVEAAVNICCESGYSINPPALLNFLEHLVQSGKMEADALLRARLLAPPRETSGGHPLEAQLLFDRLPFANRSRLRQILREMNGPANLKKILHVSGTRKSGRSWTSQLIEFHCAQTKGHLHCESAVTEDNGSAMGPLELAKDIATKLGPLSATLTSSPPVTSNEDAFIVDLAQWVISVANEPQPHLSNNRRRVWFVFDGFRTGVMRDDTAKFLVELARQCTTGVAAQLHRVVFCEFDFDVATRIRLKVQDYDVEPITVADIRLIIHDVISANPNIPASAHDTVTEEALAMVIDNADGPFVDLSGIGERLQDVIEESLA